MSFDERLASNVREVLASRTDGSERRMFGGLAFMVSGNMLCAVGADHLMLRVGVEQYETTLRRPHVSEMRFTGRPMRGYVTIALSLTSDWRAHHRRRSDRGVTATRERWASPPAPQ